MGVGMGEAIVIGLTLFFTLLATVMGLVVSALSVLIPMTMVVLIGWFLLRHGGTLVVSGPIVAAAAQPVSVGRVKVTTCRACGAHRSTPSASAYVHCDQCGQLGDWDFRAAMSDRRSRAPGPAYERLLAQLGPRIAAAKASGDPEAYEAVQREMWEAYAAACPAACPPRIGDARYRAAWVAWSAKSQALQDLDPGCAATCASQQAATSALQWDRSNPFQPVAEATSFNQLLEAVLAHQAQVVQRLEETDLLASHPDHPEADVFRRIGVSAFVQGWMPYLPKSQHEPLLQRTGLAGEYIEPPTTGLRSGPCPCCSAPLSAPVGARRVVCVACGHAVAAGAGELPCLGCGATISIPPTGPASCGYCDLRLERWA
jgi:hypothetical protein